MKDKTKALFYSLFFLGLVMKLFSTSYTGIFDMHQYHQWGTDTLTQGLDYGYKGIYFPVQYLLFSLETWISLLFNAEYYVIFKLVNLAFDIGNFAMICLILKELKIKPWYALFYWLHPCFLTMFSLGYADFQFTFFILVSVYFSLKSGLRNILFSGILLGVAFLMKPQVQILILALFIYSVFLFFRNGSLKSFLLLVFPVLFFLLFSFYFWVQNHADLLRLAETYLNTSLVMPCLNAQLLNIWFVVAFLMKNRDDNIWSVSDQYEVGGLQLKYLAMMVVIILIVLYIIKVVYRGSKRSVNCDYLLLVGFATFVVPAFMTSAHENHFFLASVLLVIFSGIFRSMVIKVFIHIFLLFQFINLYGYYGLGPEKYKLDFYNYDIAFWLSIITVLISVTIVYSFFRINTTECESACEENQLRPFRRP